MNRSVLPADPHDLRPMGRVDRALALLRDAGVPLPDTAAADQPMARLMQELTPLDSTGVVAIVRTFGRTEAFNQVVRDQIAHADIGQRYAVLAADFASVRQDTQRLIARAEHGQGVWLPRLQDFWMRLTRGTVAQRFDHIRATAKSLFRSSEDVLVRMRAVLDGYAEFRIGLKEAGIRAQGLHSKAQAALEQAQTQRETAQRAVESLPEGAQERGRLEIVRDEAVRTVRDAERREQVAADLAQNLTVSYHTGEVVMARLAQTTAAQERVWSRSVSFFQTNESVLTALSATLTSTQGLAELTRGQDVLVEGTNQALRDLAVHGGRVHGKALRTGYGATIDVAAVKQLLDAIVDYEQESRGLIATLRIEAAENAQAIAEAVSKGKERLQAVQNATPIAK